MTEYSVKLEGVTQTFGETQVLKRIDMELEKANSTLY